MKKKIRMIYKLIKRACGMHNQINDCQTSSLQETTR